MLSAGQQLTRDLIVLEERLKSWGTQTRDRMFRAYRRIGLAWKAGAVRRVPVDKGTLRQHILTNTYWEGEYELVTETGTNLRQQGRSRYAYPVYLEFGTKWIAKGRVLALGLSPYITDAQAIKDWPAKDAEKLTWKQDKQGRFRKADGRFVGSGGVEEQMPWLRTSFNAIREDAMTEIAMAMELPR